MGLRSRLRLGERRQKQITRVMELLMIGFVFIGIERGETTLIINALIALGIAQLPRVLRRDYGVPLNPGLTLWITAAVFFHAFGVVGLPGSERTFYSTVWWWDSFTHALSSSVVAAVGYTAVRAIDVHSANVHFPRRFTFVFILVFVMAFGVLWEVLEFALTEAAAAAGQRTILTQYGLDDTMFDLVFNLVGAVIVAIWGTAHLTDLSGHVAGRLDERRDG